MRCLSLALELKARGAAVGFAMTEALPGFEATLAAHGIWLNWLTGPAGGRDDATDVIALAKKLDAKSVVVDGYAFSADYRTRLKTSGLKLLVIDDYGNIGPYRDEHVLNPNVTSRGLLYRAEDTATFLLGPKYALLRPQFQSHRAKRGRARARAPRILITAGASDPKNVTAPLIDMLDSLNPIAVTVDVVIGPGFRSPARIREAVRRSRHSIRVHETPNDMAALMTDADLCITAAGSTLWELATLGVPAVALLVADNQLFGARTFVQTGCGFMADARHGLPQASVGAALTRILGDQCLRRRMGEAGRRLVDARGAARVAQLLCDLRSSGSAPVTSEPRRPAGGWSR